MDLYGILGVDRSASCEEIRIVFRKLALKYHPDKNGGDAKAKELFAKVYEAYKILGDNQKRQDYDQMLLIKNMEGLKFEPFYPNYQNDNSYQGFQEEPVIEENNPFFNSYSFYGKSPLDVLKEIFEDEEDFKQDFNISRYMSNDVTMEKAMEELRDTFSTFSEDTCADERFAKNYNSSIYNNIHSPNLNDLFQSHFDSTKDDSPQSPFSDSSYEASEIGRSYPEASYSTRQSQFNKKSSKPNSCTMTPMTEFRHVASSIYEQVFDAERADKSPFFAFKQAQKMKSPVVTSPSPSLHKSSHKISKPAKIDPRLYMKSNAVKKV